MADYIYLIQNRLTPAQWRAVEAVREAARAQGMPVFLVGGAVRDLTTGSPVRDLDFALQGDVQSLLGVLEEGGATQAGESRTLGSVYLTFRGGVRAELGPTLTISYPKPGQPETQSAAILDDLRRRDFTANAMAVSLNEGSYGLLLDPLNGTADIENRELRLVNPYGFIEQPALLLRAARLSERLGFSLEERTQGRYDNSKEEGHIAALPDEDRGYELEELFHEEDALSILEHLGQEGWAEVLIPALRPADADRSGLDAVRDLVSQLEGQGLFPDPSAINFPLLTAKLKDDQRAALKQTFVRPGFVAQIEGVEARAKELAAQLTSKQAALPSDTWRLLTEAEPTLVLWLAFHSRSNAVQAKLKAFLKEWPQARQRIPYALMQEMRITPDLPGYDKLLDDLFFALIDGKLETPEATRAFLEPYSPPAPPQVNVRRRPAKAARSRSKKAAAGTQAEAIEPDEAETVDAGVEDADSAADEPEVDAKTADEVDTIAAEVEEAVTQAAPDQAAVTEEAQPVVVAAPKVKEAARKSTVPAADAKRAATPVQAEKAATKSSSKVAAPEVKPGAGKAKGGAAVSSAPAAKKVAGKAAPVKAVAAVAPKKAAKKAEPAAKVPAKAVASKAPSKSAPAKSKPAKAVPQKAAAKKAAPAKGRSAPPVKAAAPSKGVKKAVPAKVAKKAAKKTGGRR